MKRMGRLISRRGILRKLTVFVSEYARMLDSPEAAGAGWLAIMGVNSFVEALLGTQPKSLLRETLEFFLVDLDEEVRREVEEDLRVLVEGIVQNVSPKDLETIIAKSQAKRKIKEPPSQLPVPTSQEKEDLKTLDQIINSDLSTAEKERLILEHKRHEA